MLGKSAFVVLSLFATVAVASSAELTLINNFTDASVVLNDETSGVKPKATSKLASPNEASSNVFSLLALDGGDQDTLKLYEANVEKRKERGEDVTRVSCQSAPGAGSVKITISSSPEVSALCTNDEPDGTVTAGWDKDIVITFEPAAAK